MVAYNPICTACTATCQAAAHELWRTGTTNPPFYSHRALGMVDSRARRVGELMQEASGVISTVEKVLFLKDVDLFNTLPGEELSHLAQITDEAEYQPKQTIFSEGEQGDAMYLIVDGTVKVHSGEHVFAELGTKQVFGEMSILDAEPRSASITALTELTLLKIRREDFSEILSEKPQISLGIIKVLTRRLREANRR